MSTPPIHSRRTRCKGIVLLCGKCARKLDGGYGSKGKERLKSALQRILRETGRRGDTRIVETRCLGVCPKKATTMIVTGKPGEILIIPKGTPPEEVLKHVIEPVD
jgi:predicted metal-binding protein